MKEQAKIALIVIACVIALAILVYASVSLLNQSGELEQSNMSGISNNTAVRIIDGDTFELASGDIVRLICLDAPEIGSSGSEEAANFLSSLILGKEVRMENDTDDKDAYGRLLRYVYIDDLFVNRELVQQGYATVFRYGNDTGKCDEIEQ